MYGLKGSSRLEKRIAREQSVPGSRVCRRCEELVSEYVCRGKTPYCVPCFGRMRKWYERRREVVGRGEEEQAEAWVQAEDGQGLKA